MDREGPSLGRDSSWLWGSESEAELGLVGSAFGAFSAQSGGISAWAALHRAESSVWPQCVPCERLVLSGPPLSAGGQTGPGKVTADSVGFME